MLDLANLDLSGIQEPRAQTLIRELLAIISEQGAALQAAREEIRQLHDELNRLKGEQGRPQVKPNPPQADGHGPLLRAGAADAAAVDEAQSASRLWRGPPEATGGRQPARDP